VNLGFIGFGVMGRPMAAHLMEAGHRLSLHRVKPASQHLVDAGGMARDSARAVAEAAEVVILMLPAPPGCGGGAVWQGRRCGGTGEGKLVIDMSSISPGATKDFAGRIVQQGCSYVDAPVSGGEVGAKAATLTIMAGRSAHFLHQTRSGRGGRDNA